MRLRVLALVISLAVIAHPANAGPPYVTDDPEPTEYKHFEIYIFGNGTMTHDDTGGATGLDFNYGAGPNLQLSMTVPLGYDTPSGGKTSVDLGNIELAAKYRFVHQKSGGWDASFFPRVFLLSGSSRVGPRHVSLLLPLWIGKSWGDWSTFGGGGCVINHGGGSQNFCEAAWAVTRQVLPNLQFGAELYHQSADTIGGHASTAIGAGAIYDITEHYHLLASFGPGIQNAPDINRYSWYAALGFTF